MTALRPRRHGAVRARAFVAPVWLIALVVITVAGGGLRAAVAADPHERRSADERGYYEAARGLAERWAYAERSLHWPPGAPAVFALADRVDGRQSEAGHIPGAYWAQWLLGTTLIALTFAFAALAGHRRAGVVAAAVVATYPPLIHATGELLSEPAGAFWLMAAFTALALARRRGWRVLELAAAGLLLSAAILTRANLLVMAPAIAVTLLVVLWRARGGRMALSASAALALCAALPAGLWSHKASERIGALVPVSTGGGTVFFVGTYLPGGGRIEGMKAKLRFRARRMYPDMAWGARMDDIPATPILRYVAARHPELPRDAALRREGWRNIRRYGGEDPVAFARMLLGKPPRLWLRPSIQGGLERGPALTAWHLLVVVGAMAGLVAGVARGRDPLLLTALVAVVAFTALHVPVVAVPRLALPVVPLLVAAGAAGWAAAVAQPAQSVTATRSR